MLAWPANIYGKSVTFRALASVIVPSQKLTNELYRFLQSMLNIFCNSFAVIIAVNVSTIN